MLQAKNINVEIDGREILKNVSLDIRPSEVTCLIGPSGSGKSTLIECLSVLSPAGTGVVTSISGAVVLNGKDYICGNKNNKYELPHPLITTVFQGLFLFPHLTIEQNIILPAEENNKSLSGFDDLIDKLKIRGILKKYPNECSGGERQRAALARQILLEPEYLLLDEITSALDIETIHIIADIVKELRKKGTGVLLATHMINLAKNIGDTFYFIDKGEIIEKGDITDLDNPKSDRLRDFLQTL